MSSQYEIRRLKKGESELYRAIRLESLKESPDAFGSTYENALSRSIESWTEQAESTVAGRIRITVLGFDKGVPVGVAALYQKPDRLGAAELLQVWVEPVHRGTELAASLMNFLWTWATDSGYDKVVAEVNDVNGRAISFYEKQGFTVSEELQALRKVSGKEAKVLVKPL